MKRIKGFLLAALSASTFGLIPLYANQAILDGVNNETVLAYRYGIAGVVYAVWLLARRVNMRLSCAELREVVLAGVGCYGVTAFFLMLSYHYIPTGVATAIHYFYPVVVAVLMSLVYKERLAAVVKWGIGLAIVGVGLLSWTPGEVDWRGLVFVLASTLTYGSYIVALNRPVLRRMNPDVLTCYALLFTAFFYLLVGGVQGKLEWITRPRFLLDMAQLDCFRPLAGRGGEAYRFRAHLRAGNARAAHCHCRRCPLLPRAAFAGQRGGPRCCSRRRPSRHSETPLTDSRSFPVFFPYPQSGYFPVVVPTHTPRLSWGYPVGILVAGRG